ncbi:MAG: PIG-L family deacetylase [Saprospiraceae bacterium]
MKKIYCLLVGLCCFSQLASAQKPAKPTAAELHQAIKKLNVLGSVLYVAAHPDDENQRFISYCANEKLFDVTYLSLTRGDGGQNLIGPEIREQLGVLRTEELLMARSIDGGKQRFTRANDFGFSKNPEETLRIWNRDEVLSDVVWAFRETEPDVVVNRFANDKKFDTHGHHTSSAMLSVEAFDLAGQASAYPEQLKYTQVWQARRQFFNTSWWFYGGREAFEKMDKSSLFSLDLGVYLPLKGKSNTELAAEARSMHRCQGFGSLSTRGESIEWFDFGKGDRPKTPDMFEGINTTWTRVPGGEKIGKLLHQVDLNYRDDNPSASVPDLLKATAMIQALPEGHWRTVKLTDIKAAIRNCLGLYLEATTSEPAVAPGEPVRVHLEAINRSKLAVQLTGYQILPALFDTITKQNLLPNQDFTLDKTVRIPANAPFTAPYWLTQPFAYGMYTVDNQLLRGLPETPRYAKVHWLFTVNGMPLDFETDVAYKAEESAIGEVWQPFQVLPPVTAAFEEQAYIFPGQTRQINVTVQAGRDAVNATLALEVPAGWQVVPTSFPLTLNKRGETKTLHFSVTPAMTNSGQLRAVVTLDGKPYTQRLVTIRYDHIPQQSVLLDNSVSASNVQVETKAKQIGYYMGAGDNVPAALRQMGCTVTMLTDKDLEPENLAKFEAVVIGIRAYNTKEALKFHQQKLLEYVQQGGTLVVQYNTTGELVVNDIAPFPLKISRTRVTDENAGMRLLLPNNPVLTTPNQITEADFNGWVQERGLYFAGTWDKAYEAPLSSNDPGEAPADGSLLVADYGKGHYVFTGLSFFRELPAGVPGAYRLFANLISLGVARP